jgi:rSAM/selenodomain-associated transferase 2
MASDSGVGSTRMRRAGTGPVDGQLSKRTAVTPEISIIIPVWQEAAIINRQLAHLRGIEGAEACEIIVVDGSPEAETAGAIRPGGVITMVGPRGRGAQLNCGARAARGRLLLFLHADTRLPPKAIALIRQALGQPRVAGGAFRLGIDSPRPVYRWIEAAVRLRSCLTRIPYGDQAIFVKKSVFWQAGGFIESPIMEDVALMEQLKAQRHVIRILPAAVRTSARRWEAEGVVRCTLRNWTLITLYRCGVPPDRLAPFYRGSVPRPERRPPAAVTARSRPRA